MKDQAQQMKHPVLFMLLVVAMENLDHAKQVHDLLAANPEDDKGWLAPESTGLDNAFYWDFVGSHYSEWDWDYWDTHCDRLTEQFGVCFPELEDLEVGYNKVLARISK